MLVTEYLEGGDLFTALERDSATPPKFSWWKHPVKAGEERKVQGLARRVALDTARGLAFLHHRKVRLLPAPAACLPHWPCAGARVGPPCMLVQVWWGRPAAWPG